MNRCFILEPTNVNVEAAEEFGDVQFLFKENEYRPSIWTGDYVHEVLRRLVRHSYDPKHDYFVASGHFAAVVMIAAKLTAEYGLLRLLLFHSGDRAYVEKRIQDEGRPEEVVCAG